MKKYFSLLSLNLLICLAGFAQQYQWVRGGGSINYLANGAVKGEFVKHICTDDNKNVYVVANVGWTDIEADTFMPTPANSSNGWFQVFASYDCNGDMRFAKLLESGDGGDANGLIYNKGYVYLAGVLGGINKRIGYDASFSSEHQNSFVAKFDTIGQYHWAKFVGDDAVPTRTGTGLGVLSIDGAGNLHYIMSIKSNVKLTPSLTSQTGTYDLEYDVNGNLLNVTKLQMADTNYYAYKAAIDPKTNNKYVIFQRIQPSPSLAYTFLAAFAPNGSMLWTDTCKDGGISAFRLADDGIYVTGGGTTVVPGTFWFGGMTTTNEFFTGSFTSIIKLDYNGKAIWMHTVSGTTTAGYSDLELLPNQQIAAYGHYVGKLRYGVDSLQTPPGPEVHPFIVVIDTGRNLLRMEHVTSTGSTWGEVIASDKYGSMYLGGRVGATLSPRGIPGYTSHGGNNDFYLIKYGYACNCTAMPTASFSYEADTVITGRVQFRFTGTSPADSVIWDFGDYAPRVKQPNPLHQYSQTDTFKACVTVYTACGTHRACQMIPVKEVVSVKETGLIAGIKVYPNPANEVLYLTDQNGGTAYRLLNPSGQTLLSGSTVAGQNRLLLGDLPAGVYLLQLERNGHRSTIRIMKR